MADTQQGVRHQSARDAAGTTDTYDGDLRALFNAVATVPAGSTFNEAFMLWLQSVTGSSADNINDLAALYASQQEDTYNWSSVGGLGLPTLFSWKTVNGQTLPSGTFTRASIAEEFDGTDFTQVSSGSIRENSAAVGGGAKGYLSEPAATNLVLDSDDLSTGNWTEDGVTFSDQGISTIGLRAWLMDAGTSIIVQHRAFTFPSGSGDQASSFYAKASSGQYLTLRVDGTATTDYAVFDEVSNSITEEGTGISDASIIDYGSGWRKCDVIMNVSAFQFVIAVSDSAMPGTSQPSFTGANETFDIVNPQLEATLFSTSPIVTTGSTGSRAADVLDTDVVIPEEFGALLDITLPTVIGTGNTITLLGPDATAEDIIRVDASFNVIMDDGGTPATIGTSSAGARIKVSYGRDGTGRSGSLDGATVVTGDAPGAGHEGDTFQLGAANSVNQSRSIHHVTEIYSVRPSDSQLESLSL